MLASWIDDKSSAGNPTHILAWSFPNARASQEGTCVSIIHTEEGCKLQVTIRVNIIERSLARVSPPLRMTDFLLRAWSRSTAAGNEMGRKKKEREREREKPCSSESIGSPSRGERVSFEDTVRIRSSE